jgi:integrase
MPAWNDLLLEEPDERERILSTDEETALFASLRQDYHPLFRFAVLSGIRLDNCIRLRWSQIDWEAGVIRLKVKSRKPGGKAHSVPITRAIAAVLGAERGKHDEAVFTYVCKRTARNRHSRLLMVKGRRYPFSPNGWRKAFYDAREVAKLPDFRFHDLRHTAATRTYRASRNLKAVQKMLGHEDIRTTMRYLKSDTDDVRAAMEAGQSGHTSGTLANSEGKEVVERKAK